jgi:hypothetical protein
MSLRMAVNSKRERAFRNASNGGREMALWVTSHQFATVALMSAFPDSDQIAFIRKSSLWATLSAIGARAT